jgi:RNA polymerase sigma-70 factor (ECF subfamily)
VPEPEEGDLIGRSQGGDLNAFNGLVLRYQALVYNLCLRLLVDRQAAEDATQEAFLSAHRAIGTFRGGSFRAWLLRIAANGCYDQLRRRKARPALSLNALGPANSPLDVPSSAETPDERAQRQELAAYLLEALAKLPFDQRLAILLCDVHGLPYEEIAQAIHASLGTVKSRIARGRARLRHLLLQQRELLPDPFRQLGEG